MIRIDYLIETIRTRLGIPVLVYGNIDHKRGEIFPIFESLVVYNNKIKRIESI